MVSSKYAIFIINGIYQLWRYTYRYPQQDLKHFLNSQYKFSMHNLHLYTMRHLTLSDRQSSTFDLITEWAFHYSTCFCPQIHIHWILAEYLELRKCNGPFRYSVCISTVSTQNVRKQVILQLGKYSKSAWWCSAWKHWTLNIAHNVHTIWFTWWMSSVDLHKVDT